jgi:two-component system response regulator FixJ
LVDRESIVFIVGGDSRARRALAARVAWLDMPAKVCRSADEFFAIVRPADAGCLLLSISSPTVDLEILQRQGDEAVHLPVVAISELRDISLAVTAMKLGARDFLEQSCPDEQLAEAIEESLRWHASQRRHILRVQSIRRRLLRLDAGHREVLNLVVRGRPNREIAAELKLSARSIEVRRARIMQTMRAHSLAELVRQMTLVERAPRRRADGEVGSRE